MDLNKIIAFIESTNFIGALDAGYRRFHFDKAVISDSEITIPCFFPPMDWPILQDLFMSAGYDPALNTVERCFRRPDGVVRQRTQVLTLSLSKE